MPGAPCRCLHRRGGRSSRPSGDATTGRTPRCSAEGPRHAVGWPEYVSRPRTLSRYEDFSAGLGCGAGFPDRRLEFGLHLVELLDRGGVAQSLSLRPDEADEELLPPEGIPAELRELLCGLGVSGCLVPAVLREFSSGLRVSGYFVPAVFRELSPERRDLVLDDVGEFCFR